MTAQRIRKLGDEVVATSARKIDTSAVVVHVRLEGALAAAMAEMADRADATRSAVMEAALRRFL
jgi:hypothetical protein